MFQFDISYFVHVSSLASFRECYIRLVGEIKKRLTTIQELKAKKVLPINTNRTVDRSNDRFIISLKIMRFFMSLYINPYIVRDFTLLFFLFFLFPLKPTFSPFLRSQL